MRKRQISKEKWCHAHSILTAEYVGNKTLTWSYSMTWSTFLSGCGPWCSRSKTDWQTRTFKLWSTHTLASTNFARFQNLIPSLELTKDSNLLYLKQKCYKAITRIAHYISQVNSKSNSLISKITIKFRYWKKKPHTQTVYAIVTPRYGYKIKENNPVKPDQLQSGHGFKLNCTSTNYFCYFLMWPKKLVIVPR